MRASWTPTRIGELGSVITGITPPSSRPGCFGARYPFITPGDMHVDKRVRATGRCLSEEGAKLLQRKRLPADSVCVSCIGWQMGNVVMTASESFTNQQLNSIVPNSKVLPDFLYYALKPRKRELLSLGSAIGVRTPILKKSAFEDLMVDLPPTLEQERIASILSAYDALVENNLRRIRILEEIARGLYREWFVRFRFPGRENVRFVDSPLGVIPEGWKTSPLAEFGELTVGGDWGKDEPMGPEWVEVACLRGVDIDRLWTTGDTEPRTRWVKQKSLVRRRIAPTDVIVEGSGECGRSLPGSEQLEKLFGYPVIYSNFCKRLRFNDPPTARYVARVLNEMVASGAMQQYRTGTTIPNLNARALTESHRFLLPPAELLRAYDEFASLAGSFRLSGRNRVLRRTRDLLLPKLMSGELDVSELDIAVPGEAA